MVASREIQVKGLLFTEIFPTESKQKFMSQKSLLSSPNAVMSCYIRLTCVTRKMFVDVTAPKRSLSKTHETI